MTQVFDAISDAIVVVQEQDESSEDKNENTKCLFVNKKSLEIFGEDLINALEEIDSNQPSLPSLYTKKFRIDEEFSNNLSSTHLLDSEVKMLNLNEIIKRFKSVDSTKSQLVESYTMIKQDQEEKTYLFLKRIGLSFNNKNCQVLNFTDMTAYKQLE